MTEKAVILIVDDQPKNIELLEAYLLPHGYEIMTALSGEDALEILAGNHIDLILLDVMMPPGIDGFEVTRRIRQESKCSLLPVIMITALQESEYRVRGIEAGCDDFISKPFDKMALFARVRSLLNKAKLEAMNRHIEKTESLVRMTGAIAHHFNNQLQAVMGHLELAIEDLPQDTGAVQNLNKAMKALHKAARVSDLMLTCLGQRTGREEPLDLFEGCSRIMPMIQACMPKHVTLKINVISPSPVIKADVGQIQQVAISLLTNGWEAIGENQGEIHLMVSTVAPADISASHRFPVDWQPQNRNYASLEVRDSGCGIDEKEIKKLFDPFFSTRFTGRGLGLSVLLGIVKERSGAVTVESQKGKGSLFRVFFPLSEKQTACTNSAEELPRRSADIEAIAPKTQKGGTLMVVDDDEMVRKMGMAMLTRLGFKVLEAKDGVEAVDVFRQHQDEIRLVLCDLSMPRMNGWQTIAALRKLVPDIPVILVSGYDEARVMADDDHSELLHEFLHKPYHMADLKAVLERTLQGRYS